jgi:predicted GNAT superfamily acetyltransferase
MAPSTRDLLVSATADAGAAAARAEVEVRTLHDVAALEHARGVFDAVWPVVGGGTNLTSNLVRAVEHAGGYVVAAYDTRTGADPGRPVAAAFAFLGRADPHPGRAEPTTVLHSHMAAALDGHRDRHIGTALKLHQRAWALRHGVPVVTWTFDPLVRRNVRFNLVKLGVVVDDYLVDFYGDMDDELNQNDRTDRLLAWWEVASPRAAAAAAGRVAALERAPGDAVVVPLPADIIAIRQAAPRAALTWRLRVRETVLGAMAEGLRIDAVTTDGALVLRRPGPEGTA